MNNSFLDREFVKNNLLDEIRELKERLGILERAALTGTSGDLNLAGNFHYNGNLIPSRLGSSYIGYSFVPLQAPLTSTSWDGDSFSDTSKTLIDLSAVFGVPPAVKAVLLYIAVQDSGSASADTYLILSPNSTSYEGIYCSPMPVNDRRGRYCQVVPCTADGDIYYQVEASGAGTFDIWIQVWGYWV